VLYGLGTTIGAGIYVLVGEVAGIAGSFTPLAFIGASLLAGVSAGSFAELSARFPLSAGEALYVREGLGSRRLGTLVGLMVVASGAVSAATITNGFAGYLFELWNVAQLPAALALVVFLCAVAAWGIGESVRIAAAITLIEIFGLGLVLWVTRSVWVELPQLGWDLLPADSSAWSGVGVASVLAFYAFLGFEDMVNVAEEVKDPRRAVPRAIAITLGVTMVLYALVAIAAVATVPPAELAASEAPLALVFERGGGGDARILGAIAILAVTNGALIQIIMASRVFYGLGSRGDLPRVLARVHPTRRTPVFATALVGAFVAILAAAFPLRPLAEATSVIALAVFALVNLSLVRLHQKSGSQMVPTWVPIAGATVSLGVLGTRIATALF
jgi:amino acid transporter